ncbi:MAG: hypothetical protein GYB65_02500 [Chloroflexi bacterium]|nr:hypothetical protein [Chloroflexota bacterium]
MISVDRADASISLVSEYTTPYSAIVRDEVVMGVNRYFLERWLPVLGPNVASVVNTLRQLDYRCHGEVISISGTALAREAAMSRRHLYTCLEHTWLPAFVRLESGQKVRDAGGKITQQANRYRVRMDDPLTPADADHLLTVLQNLADTPLDAAQRALELDAKSLWAPVQTQASEHFTTPRAFTAQDVLHRAFPTWTPATPAEKSALAQAAENLHRHITLVRDDGRTSRIIVPQYFRRKWWKLLGHDLAWAYLWLRGTVYDNPAEGVQRDTCWVPALNTILTVIGRTREWWRRNVENAKENDGWTLDDFFRQLATQKGRDPAHPQWVARQFTVALNIPIAPEDRERYHYLLNHWPEGGGMSHESATNEHTGSNGVRHKLTHRTNEGPPQIDTPDQALSATTKHTGSNGVRHTGTHGSATTAHRESESKEQAPDSNSAQNSNNKHPDPPPALPKSPLPASQPPVPDAAAAKKMKAHVQEKTLVDQLAHTLANAPKTPLCEAASATLWLEQTWLEPVRRHTPAWDLVASGQVSARDLVALLLAIWCDRTITHPPRYLSWLMQRWQMQADMSPVEHWEQWQFLAGLPIGKWLDEGRKVWIEHVPRDDRALPFGLDVIASEQIIDSAYTDASSDANPEDDPLTRPWPVPPKPEVEQGKGLDERPGRGNLTIREIWIAALGQLSAQLNRSTFSMWLAGTRVVSYEDGVLTIKPPRLPEEDWLRERLNYSIELAVSSIAKMPITIRYAED